MRISDWSSDVCSSDLILALRPALGADGQVVLDAVKREHLPVLRDVADAGPGDEIGPAPCQFAPAEANAALARRRHPGDRLQGRALAEIGRASCRERGGQYVKISVVAVSLKKKQTADTISTDYIHNQEQDTR